MTENDDTNENDGTNDGTNDVAGDKRNPNLGAANENDAHPFDQTNDIVDGLEGDADDPEVVEQRQDTDESVNPLTGQHGDDTPA